MELFVSFYHKDGPTSFGFGNTTIVVQEPRSISNMDDITEVTKVLQEKIGRGSLVILNIQRLPIA